MNKIKFFVLSFAVLGLLSAHQAHALTSAISLSVPSSMQVGVASTFTANVPQSYVDQLNRGSVNIENAGLTDISSVEIQRTNTLLSNIWVNVPLSQTPSGVQAALDGLSTNMSFRVVFANNHPTSLNFTVTDSAGSLIDSATSPVTIQQNPQILGESKFNFTKNLSYGSTGDDVTKLQQTLTDLGIYHGPITGFYGSLTTAAVKNFQALHNISTTGTVGPLTRAALNQ